MEFAAASGLKVRCRLRTDRSLLVILDGSKALHKAVTQTFGSAVLMHRCQVHKLSNILEHLPEGQRPWVRAIVTRASKQVDVAAARRLLQDLARRLEDRYLGAAASVREGLDDTLTIILTLGLFDRKALSNVHAGVDSVAVPFRAFGDSLVLGPRAGEGYRSQRYNRQHDRRST